MKKIFCFLLAIVMILGLCACGGKDYDKKKLEIATERAAHSFYFAYGRGLFPTKTINPTNIDLTYKSVKKVSDNTYYVTGDCDVTYDSGYSESGTYNATIEVKDGDYMCTNFNGADLWMGVVLK